jgi:hypothetical protein
VQAAFRAMRAPDALASQACDVRAEIDLRVGAWLFLRVAAAG